MEKNREERKERKEREKVGRVAKERKPRKDSIKPVETVKCERGFKWKWGGRWQCSICRQVLPEELDYKRDHERCRSIIHHLSEKHGQYKLTREENFRRLREGIYGTRGLKKRGK